MLQIAMLIVQLLPAIFGAVRAVEAAIPNPGQGAAKLNTVLTALSGVALDAPLVVSSGADVINAVKVGDVPGISTALTHAINASVQLFNAAGVFQKSGAVQAITAMQADQAARDATITG